jgi:hypothetical protein
MVQGGNRSRFALEPFRELFGGNLDRDVAADTRVFRSVYFSHTANADPASDLVRT